MIIGQSDSRSVDPAALIAQYGDVLARFLPICVIFARFSRNSTARCDAVYLIRGTYIFNISVRSIKPCYSL